MNKLLFLFTDNFIEYELLKASVSDYEVHYYPDITQFKNDNRKKIAVFHYVDNFENLSELPLIADMSAVDLLVLYHWDEVIKSPEEIHKDIFQSFNTEKYIVIVGGYNTTYSYNKNKFLTDNFSHGHFILHNPSYTKKPQSQSYDFECLFGTAKPARKYLYYKLLENNLLDKSVVNIQWQRSDWLEDVNYNTFWPNISADLEKTYGDLESYRSNVVDKIDSHRVTSPGSNLGDFFVDVVNNKKLDQDCYFNRAYSLPENIYNVTKYSLVSETYQSHVLHPTEKTAKMFLAKRIFVMFSSQHFLKNLKNMGFKTFSNIIDESYDDIADTRIRFDYAFEQVKYLSTANYDELLKNSKDILKHNYHVLTDIERSFKKIKIFIDNNI